MRFPRRLDRLVLPPCAFPASSVPAWCTLPFISRRGRETIASLKYTEELPANCILLSRLCEAGRKKLEIAREDTQPLLTHRPWSSYFPLVSDFMVGRACDFHSWILG